MAGATGLHEALERFDGGRVVIDVADLPVKCPVAPLEFAFLADWYFQRRGIRDRVELTYATPLDAAFTKPVAAKALGGLLADKGIELVTEFTLGRVDGAGGRLVSYDERELPFDLAVVVPLHGGAEYVGRSEGLGDELGFVPVDPHTLEHIDRPEVFAIGDAAGLPASKAGSVAHFEGEVLVHNIGRFLAGQPLDASFDGHTNCFVETLYRREKHGGSRASLRPRPLSPIRSRRTTGHRSGNTTAGSAIHRHPSLSPSPACCWTTWAGGRTP
ncbi:FAD/NAD(P)-binding oxidoreductase [Streptomyces sp900105755]|uniref:FAD/NAD(P)-binding oxidoreductase n=1 Tax=Streptomyces sp. 900105755 TaxID=3154389 RepID=UPI003321929D